MKKIAISVSVILFIFLISVFPKQLIPAASDSLCLWYSKVLPSLLPFAICMNILTKIDFPQALGKKLGAFTEYTFHVNGCGAFPFIMGITAGFPSGAKAISDLYEQKLLSSRECQSLLSFCNNPGPIFVIATVGFSFFGDEKIGYLIVTASLLSSVVVGIIFGHMLKPNILKNKTLIALNKNSLPTIGELITSSVVSSSETLIIIGGCMMLFGMLIKVFYIFNILSPNGQFFNALIAGLLEMTTGSSLTGSLNIPLVVKVSLATFILNFGGASIQLQVLGLVSNIPFSRSLYIVSQIIKAMIASCISIGLLYLLQYKTHLL